ncbi:aminotransferase class IV [Sulfurivirga caldicuralii]|uniref:aminotransferase class IV n=1 Tax=Sulfurivirga caldicuralii TaxID=364032 RepID=UPI0013565B12|nr:aminotransferase class IV [Sulfurivirga caldicuralii]
MSLWDRGLHYGDGFFTTIRVEQGALLNWSAHKQRIIQSLKAMHMPPANAVWLEADLKTILPQLKKGSGVLKCILTRGEMGGRGYRPPQSPKLTRLVMFQSGLPRASTEALTLTISSVLWPTPDVYPGIKHLNRLAQVEALRVLPENAPEALMLDAKQNVVSGVASAVVAKLGRTLYLPELSEAGVESTTVFALRQCAQVLGYQVHTIPLSLGRVMHMDGLALANAVRLLQPVGAVKGGIEKRFETQAWAPLADILHDFITETAWREA